MSAQQDSFSGRMDDPDSPLYTVGQVADLLGVQPAFLRRLDTEHVVEPARSEGGQRRYSRREIERIGRVAELAADGLSLEGIKRLLVLEAEVTSLEDQLSVERRKNTRKN